MWAWLQGCVCEPVRNVSSTSRHSRRYRCVAFEGRDPLTATQATGHSVTPEKLASWEPLATAPSNLHILPHRKLCLSPNAPLSHLLFSFCPSVSVSLSPPAPPLDCSTTHICSDGSQLSLLEACAPPSCLSLRRQHPLAFSFSESPSAYHPKCFPNQRIPASSFLCPGTSSAGGLEASHWVTHHTALSQGPYIHGRCPQILWESLFPQMYVQVPKVRFFPQPCATPSLVPVRLGAPVGPAPCIAVGPGPRHPCLGLYGPSQPRTPAPEPPVTLSHLLGRVPTAPGPGLTPTPPLRGCSFCSTNCPAQHFTGGS